MAGNKTDLKQNQAELMADGYEQLLRYVKENPTQDLLRAFVRNLLNQENTPEYMQQLCENFDRVEQERKLEAKTPFTEPE
jgi:hypothetical protein